MYLKGQRAKDINGDFSTIEKRDGEMKLPTIFNTLNRHTTRVD